MLLLNSEQQIVEGFPRPNLGDGRIVAAAAHVLQPSAFALVLLGGPAFALVQVFVKAPAPIVESGLADLLASQVGLLRVDQKLSLGIDDVGRAAQVASVRVIMARIIGI